MLVALRGLNEKENDEMQTRKQVLLLGVVVVCVVALCGTSYGEDPAKYVGSQACKMCHADKAAGEQYNLWKDSKHAKAYESLLTDKAKEMAAKAKVETPPAESPECLRCHTTGYDKAAKSSPAGVTAKDGVTCEQCHGPGSLHQKDGTEIKFKKATDVKIGAHVIQPDAKVCEKCHNSESPTWNPEKYTLADGKKAGFDFEQANKATAHYIPDKAPWIK